MNDYNTHGSYFMIGLDGEPLFTYNSAMPRITDKEELQNGIRDVEWFYRKGE
jgi:hypothetical protein